MLSIISIIISGISLVISVFLIIRTWWIERFKIDFEMTKWFGIHSDGGKPIFLWLYITNHSKLPCSVLEIKIHNERNGQISEGFGTGDKKLVSTTTATGRKPEDTYSLDYPVKIEPYNSIGGYFHVVSKFGFMAYEEDIIKITVRTSRGVRTKKVFMDYGKNTFRVWEYRNPNNDVKITKRSDGSIINYLEFIEHF